MAMNEERIEEIRDEVNDWSIEDLEELISTLQMFVDSLKEEIENEN